MITRTIAMAGALALVAFAPLTAADGTFTGTITMGQPAGISSAEILGACDTSYEAPDGVWFDISEAGSRAFVLTMDATLDADAYFYDADCGFIDSSTGAQEFIGDKEDGPIPEGAHYVVVNGYLGFGDFSLEIKA